MKTVEATDTVRIGAGTILKLSREQAAARVNRLKAREDGLHEALELLEFKRGEKFGVVGDIPKSMVEFVSIDGEPAAPKPEPAPAGPVKFVMPKPEDMPIRGHKAAKKK
jgi:hypothetical protein